MNGASDQGVCTHHQVLQACTILFGDD